MKPILYQVDTFDANNAKKIYFTWSGNQSYSNLCTIRNNLTNAIIYQQEETTYQLFHTIPKQSLANGVLYNITIQVRDATGALSDEADSTLFYCFSTPIFNFTNVTNNQTIRNSAYSVTMSYYQAENEPLQAYTLNVCDSSKNIVYTSGVTYDITDLSHIIKNLEDDYQYTLYATGVTLNGLEFQTDSIPFIVDYIVPSIYSLVSVENIYDNGYILIRSNVKSVEGHCSSTAKFINGDYLDLTNNSFTIDADFNLSDDYSLSVKMYKVNYGLFMTFGNQANNHYYRIYKRHGIYECNDNKDKMYLEMLIPIGFTYYIIQSNYIDIPNDTDILDCWIIKKDGVFQLEVTNKGGA